MRKAVRLAVPDLARLSGDGQPWRDRPASTTNRSGIVKSRLYAKSLTGLICLCYQDINGHFAALFTKAGE